MNNNYQSTTWDLSALLPDATEETLAARLAALDAAVAAFEEQRGALRSDMAPAALVALVQQYEAILVQAYRLYGYASLWFSADTQAPAALTFMNRVQQALTVMQNRLLFFDLWWKGLEDDAAVRLLPSAELHPDYRFFLEDMRRTRRFTLDEKSEQLINLKDADGMSALITVYAMLTNRLEYTLTIDGEARTMTRDELMAHVYAPDPGLRAAAYQEMYRVYANRGEHPGADLLEPRARLEQRTGDAARLQFADQCAQHRQRCARRCRGHAARRLPAQRRDLPTATFALKAQWLGMDKLRRYDIYAPLAASDRKVDYADAVEMVLDTFEHFDPGVARHALRVFADNHIDSEPRKGKRGGAFCSTVLPELTPWVLTNFSGKVRDVATLAHELGHAIHSMLAEHHSLLTQHASLPLAETASVFSEMLLTDRLMAEEPDPLVRRELLAGAVDDMYATVLRQAFFVLFEQEAHAAILAGASPEQLNELYMANLREQFGDAVEVSDEFRYEWVSIPHIYNTPFYCYAYSFGQLLVLALYRPLSAGGRRLQAGLPASAGVRRLRPPGRNPARGGRGHRRPGLLAGRV
jgi:oligoendopeptidase F